MKRAIIVGATSGMGKEVSKCLLAKGWSLGLAGRRKDILETMRAENPERVAIQTIDVMSEDASDNLQKLISAVGGMDLFFLTAGMGHQNPTLKEDIEIHTAETNVSGFIRMTTTAFRYFSENGGGHIAVISSIAGTKGLGAAPAYSATKGFQNIYIEALSQLARMKKANIVFTDIRPGFVDTALLDSVHKYPMLMRPEKVANIIVKAIEKHKRIVVIDWRYRILVFFWKLVPHWLWERLNISN